MTKRSKRLGRDEVFALLEDLSDHIAREWDTYKKNLPCLGKTMMVYDQFCYAIRCLPECHEVEFDLRMILESSHEFLGHSFGNELPENVHTLILTAMPANIDEKIFCEYTNSHPEFHGFETVAEFSAQKKALNLIRLHPRVVFAMERFEAWKVQASKRHDNERRKREAWRQRMIGFAKKNTKSKR